MGSRHNARGITLIGFIIVLMVLGFFAYAAMRLVPVYIEYFGVVKAMEQVKSEPGSAQKSLEELRSDMYLKFNTQYVDDSSVPRQAISMVRNAGGVTLRVAYERRIPFISNIELLAKFDKSIDLANGG